MTAWAEEEDAALQMANNAVRELLAIDPHNELLWYWLTPPEGTDDPFDGDERKCSSARKDRFWQREEPWQEAPGAIVTTIVTANYLLAVEAEIGRISVNKEKEV